MTDLQAKIDALPEWPKWKDTPVTVRFPNELAEHDPCCHALLAYGAALARLALLRDELNWIESQYDDNEPPHVLAARLYDVCCTARRLLAATEVPHD